MVEALLRPCGPYSLALSARAPAWQAELQGGRWAQARQHADGRVLVRASCARAVDEARFLLALDDDTTAFHRRFACDPLLGPSLRLLRGLRPLRRATVAHAGGAGAPLRRRPAAAGPRAAASRRPRPPRAGR